MRKTKRFARSYLLYLDPQAVFHLPSFQPIGLVLAGRFALGVVYGVCAVSFLGYEIRYVLHAARKVENNLAGKADVLTGKAFQPQQLVYLGFVLAVKAFAVVFGWLISILPFPRFGIGVIEPLLVVLVEVN